MAKEKNEETPIVDEVIEIIDFVDEPIKKPSEFVAWKVAIDIHNGVYGFQVNEQYIKVKEALNLTDEQVNEVMAIKQTIKY